MHKPTRTLLVKNNQQLRHDLDPDSIARTHSRTIMRERDLYAMTAVSTQLLLHLHVVAVLAQILQQVAAFEVLVGMNNSFKLCCCHDTLVFGALDLSPVHVVEDTVGLC